MGADGGLRRCGLGRRGWMDGLMHVGGIREQGMGGGGVDRRDIEVEMLVCNPWKGVGVRRAFAGVGVENVRIKWERMSYLISGCGRVS